MESLEFQKILFFLKSQRMKYEDNWEDWEKQFIGKLPPRVTLSGDTLPTVNLNETFKNVLTATRFAIKGFWTNKLLYKIHPSSFEYIKFTQVLNHYLTHKVKQIKELYLTLLKTFMRTYIFGFAATKLSCKDSVFELDPINITDLWVDEEAPRFADIRHIMQKVRRNMQELEATYGAQNVEKLQERIVKAQPPQEKLRKIMPQSFDVYELWYLEDGDWNVATAITEIDSEEIIAVFRDEKADLVYGHPFIFWLGIPRHDSLFGWGEPELVREKQSAMNKLLNLGLDDIEATISPPLLYNIGAVEHARELEGLLDPYGGIVGVSDISGVRPQTHTPINPQVFQLIAMLRSMSEMETGAYEILMGIQPERREPYSSTARRIGLAQGMMEFRMNILGNTGLKTLGQKILLHLLANPPKKELIKIEEKEEEEKYIEVKGGLKEELVESTEEGILKTFLILSKVPKKDMQSFEKMEVVPAFQDIISFDEKRQFVESLGYLAQILGVAPELKDEIDWRGFARLFLSKQGIEIASLLKKKPKISGEMIRAMAPEMLKRFKRGEFPEKIPKRTEGRTPTRRPPLLFPGERE